MTLTRLLAPRPGPVPDAWVLVSRVAAAVVLLCVASSRWVPVDLALLAPLGLDRLGGLGPVVALLALLLWVGTGVLAGAVVLLGVRRPLAAIGLALLPLLAVVVLGSPVPFAVIAVLAGITVSAAWRSPTASVLATLAAIATVVLWFGVQVPMQAPLGSVVELQLTDGFAVAVLYALGLGGLLAGTLVGRAGVASALDARQRVAARSAEVEEQSEVTAERARLARDLHDVVAHHVSLIAVRAETAPYTHPGLQPEARSVLAEIASDARRALDELRGVLGILGRSVGDRAPQPSWSDVAALVERSSSSGERVVLVGDPVERVAAGTDPALGYVAYRVVQEGLTNARKHAPGAATTVRLERTAGLAVVSVVTAGAGRRSDDDEPTAPITPVPAPTRPLHVGVPTMPGTTGHGLVGMRERVEALGGRLVAGPRDGGFALEATLPVGAGGVR